MTVETPRFRSFVKRGRNASTYKNRCLIRGQVQLTPISSVNLKRTAISNPSANLRLKSRAKFRIQRRVTRIFRASPTGREVLVQPVNMRAVRVDRSGRLIHTRDNDRDNNNKVDIRIRRFDNVFFIQDRKESSQSAANNRRVLSYQNVSKGRITSRTSVNKLTVSSKPTLRNQRRTTIFTKRTCNRQTIHISRTCRFT